MTAVESNKTNSISYPAQTVERAERAVRCSPFQLPLFAAMQQQSVTLASMAGSTGLENQYTTTPITELAAETALLWLIQVGLLRREVDGQGITDSFRLTPLGRQLVEKWQQAGNWPAPTLADRLKNTTSRWCRLPI
jgi:hypothetical protein